MGSFGEFILPGNNWEICFKIIVVNEHFKKISLRQALIRRMVISIPPGVIGAGISIVEDEKSQGWHDKAVKTFVIFKTRPDSDYPIMQHNK